VKEASAKERIMTSAFEEFADNYYDNASINTIIKNSKTSKGTFYHYFQNKEDLYFKLIDRIVQEKLDFLNRRMSEEFKPGSELKLFDENFKMITRIAMEFAASKPLYYEMGVKMLAEPNLNIIDVIQKKYGNQSDEFVGKLVERMYEAGGINKKLTKEFVIKMISFVLSNYTIFVPVKDRNDFNKMIGYLDQVYEVLENGIRRKKIKQKK